MYMAMINDMTTPHVHLRQGARLNLAQVHMHKKGGEGFDSPAD